MELILTFQDKGDAKSTTFSSENNKFTNYIVGIPSASFARQRSKENSEEILIDWLTDFAKYANY